MYMHQIQVLKKKYTFINFVLVEFVIRRNTPREKFSKSGNRNSTPPDLEKKKDRPCTYLFKNKISKNSICHSFWFNENCDKNLNCLK